MPDIRKLGRVKPPRAARWMLRLALPQPQREFFLGDLEEQFNEEVLPRAGRTAADRWYWKQAWAAAFATPPPKHPWEKRKGAGLMETFLQDVRQGLRRMVKNPAFTLVALLTLALGIGANAAIFSVVNSMLLKPLPYPQPEQLAMVWETALQYGLPRITLSPLDVQDYAAAKSFVASASWTEGRFNYAGDETPIRLYSVYVPVSFFPTVGVQPFLGRAFTAEDTRESSDVVIVSHRFWRASLGADKNILGRAIRLSGRNRTVIGVMPESFSFPPPLAVEGAAEPASDVFVPLWMSPQEIVRTDHNYKMMARLTPGVTLAQAQSELAPIHERIVKENPEVHAGVGLEVLSLHGQVVEKTRPALLVLIAAVGFVMLIACANLANLFLAKAVARERETAVRTALGASRGRLVRAFLTEGLVLSMAGAAAGVLLCVALVRLIPLAGLHQIPRLEEARVDGRVVAFALGLSLLAALVFGIVPAWQASRASVQDALKEGGRGSGLGRSSAFFRQGLIAAEVAVAIVLLVGAGLLIRSFAGLQKADLGFNPRNVLSAEFQIPGAKYPGDAQRYQFFHDLIERVQTIPGVTSAAAVRSLPLTGSGWQPVMAFEGHEVRKVADGAVVEAAVATPGYFHTMGIPLMAGREFSAADLPGKTPVTIVDEVFVNRWLAGQNPIGKRIREALTEDTSSKWFEIVGVVKSVRRSSPADEMKPSVYFPHGQRPFTNMTLVVRTSVPPSSVLGAVRQQLAQLDREQPMAHVMTLEEEFSSAVSQPRFTAWLLGAFAAVALLLAAVGAYSVISYSVTQRTHEIGVRMALGAAPGDVRGMVLRQGMGVVVAGAGLGLACALGLARALGTMLYGVSSTDPATYTVVTLLLLATALLACWIPARRATRVDPLIALRHE